MAFIDAARFSELKKRVQAECLRRCYTGSVVEYGSDMYAYENEPEKGHLSLTEHYEKLAVPLAAINEDKVPGIDGKRIVSESELASFEAALTLFETRPMSDTNQGDCKTSCTGACYTGCSSTCTGTCGGSCSGTCLGSCTSCSSCYGSCYGCTGCSMACMNNCYTGCEGTCKGSCTVTCGNNGCVGSCLGLCHNGCVSSCQEACGYCGNNCTGVSK